MNTPSKINTTRRRVLAAAAALTLVLGVSACGKASEKLSEKIAEKGMEAAGGGNADIDVDDGSFTMKTEDGEFSTKTANELPDGWPTDIFPVADGFVIENVTETKTPDGAMTIVSIRGDGDPGDLIDFYVDAFESEGLEIGLQSKSGDGGMVNGTDGSASYGVMAGADANGEVGGTLSVTVYAESSD